MGDNFNRSDLEEVDNINHLLLWGIVGAVVFLFGIGFYYFARIEIDSRLQTMFRKPEPESGTVKTDRQKYLDNLYTNPR